MSIGVKKDKGPPHPTLIQMIKSLCACSGLTNLKNGDTSLPQPV